jgi:hypothetical protein
MTRRLIIVLAAAALLAVAAVPAVVHGAAITTKACGLTERIEGVRYQVRETKGTLSCKTVKRVVNRFMSTGSYKRPWFCVFNHGDTPFAASCSRGESVLVRVYAPN